MYRVRAHDRIGTFFCSRVYYADINRATKTGHIILWPTQGVVRSLVVRKPTCTFRISNSTQEDGDKPLEGVLVHGVYVGEVCDAEEEDLSVDGNRDVEGARFVNILLSLFRNHNLRLQTQHLDCRTV